MQTYWVSRGTAPLIPNLGIIYRLVVSLKPRPLYSRCPLNGSLEPGLGEPWSPFGRHGEKKFLAAGIRTPDLAFRSLY